MLRRLIATLCFTFMAGLMPAQPAGASPQVESFRALQSQYPAEPMSLSPAPYRGSILVLAEDSAQPPSGTSSAVAQWVAIHLAFSAQGGIGVILATDLPEYRDFAAGNDDSGESLSEDERARLLAYLAPTAYVVVTAGTDDQGLIARCRMTGSKGELTREFRSPATNDLELAQTVAKWVAENSGIAYLPAELDGLGKPLLGQGASNSESTFKSIREGGLSTLLEADPGNAALRYFGTRELLEQGKGEDAAKLFLKGPIDLTARACAYDHLAQAAIFESGGGRGPALRERLIASALHPLNEDVYREGIAALPPARLDDDFVMAVNNWRKRLGGRPIDQARAARLMQMTARHHMPPDGFAAAEWEAKDAMAYYARAAEDDVQAALKRVGPLSPFAELAMYDMMLQEQRDGVDAMFERALKNAAASRALWAMRIHIEDPMMGGTPDKFAQLFQRVMKEAEAKPSLGLVPWDVLQLKSIGAPRVDYSTLAASSPGEFARVQAGVQASLAGSPSATRYAEAIHVLWSVGDKDGAAEAAKQMPAEYRRAAKWALEARGSQASALFAGGVSGEGVVAP